jgi:hypothetical protein
VRHWEIWNEPNLSNFWLPGPQPSKYADLLNEAATRIRSIQPEAQIVSAGLSPYGAPGDQTATRMNPVTFLQAMYAAGAQGSFDALGMHPYNHPSAPVPGHPAAAWTQLESTSPSLRSVMSENGDAGLKIWGTEFGYPTCQTEAHCVSESQQAEFTEGALHAWGGAEWAGPMMLFQLVDSGEADSAETRFGFFRSDLSEKPVTDFLRSYLLS